MAVELTNYDTKSYVGNQRERRIVSISAGNDRFILPVTPHKYSVQTAQDNTTVDILDFGELLLFGNTKLTKLKFGCFFPAVYHKYPFVVGDTKPPDECIELLTNWRTSKTPVRVIITQSPVNMMFAIMSLDFREQDGSRDVYFDLSLTEYRDLNTPQSNNDKTIDSTSGLKNRPSTARDEDKQQRFIDNARDVLEAFKHSTGSFSYTPTDRISIALKGLF